MLFWCSSCARELEELVPYCPFCYEDGSVVPAPLRRPNGAASAPRVATARELGARRWKPIEVPACPGLRLLKGALVLVYGEPGAGKSTLALRALDSIGGPVVALLAEEGDGPAVAERIERLGIARDDFYVVPRASRDELAAIARERGARAVLVDSVSAAALEPHDARELLAELGLRAFFGVLQVNKTGEMAGRKEWEHEADAVLLVDAGRWTVTKTRFQPEKPTGEVFP